MAVQSYLVGVFFLVGVVAGLVVSYIATSFTGNSVFIASSALGPREVVDIGPRVTDTPPIPDGKREGEGAVYRPPMTHEEVDRAPIPEKIQEFKDELYHQDNDEIAKELFDKVRVLCWIMTAPENLDKKAKHVKATWGKRCNKLIFVSDHEDPSFPTIKIHVEHGRDHLTAKTMAAFDYIYENYIDEADWFLKADDDTYVILENLRYMLSTYKPTQPIYFGHHFKVIVKQGYFSGGGGYAVSREALTRFGKRTKGTCAGDHGAEDVEWGRCMEQLGVVTGDSRDAMGRSRFHCFDAATFIHGGYPDWYLQYDKYGAQKGLDTVSDYAITFHYITVENMYNLEYFVYHLKPYGILSGIQDLNRKGQDKVIQPALHSLGKDNSPDKGAQDNAVPDKGAQDNAVPDKGAQDNAVPDNGAQDNAVPDNGAQDNAVPDKSSPDKSVPEGSIPDKSRAERYTSSN